MNQIIFWGVSIIIILFTLWFLLLLVPLLLYRLSKVYSSYYFKTFGRKDFWLMFLFPLLFFRYKYVQRNKEFKGNNPHIALILANNWFPEKYLAYGLRIDLLIKYLKDNKKPYKVYDRLNAMQIKSIIKNKKVKAVLIFGHGSKHSVQTSENETLYYCEFAKCHKKDFIAQFHCNPGGGKSLAEYISKEDTLCFITDEKQRDSDINKQINKIIKDKLL